MAGRYEMEPPVRRDDRGPAADDESFTASGVTYRRDSDRQDGRPANAGTRRPPDRTYMHGEGYAGGYDPQAPVVQGDDFGARTVEPGHRGLLDRAADEVASWFGNPDARRRRQGDAALEARFSGQGPRDYVRSDRRIHEDVCDRLTDDSWIDATSIDVTVSGGEVTLAGYVDSREDKRWAEECAETVTGVKHVQNNLRIKAVGERAMTPGNDQTPV